MKMSQYFAKPYEAFDGDINVKVDLDTSRFALKPNLANLKTEVDKSDIDKLVPVPVDMSKLSAVVKHDVIKKTDYNTKKTEIENTIPGISNLATKTALNTVANKIPGTSGLVKRIYYNAKITEIEGKIPDVTNLVKKTALITVENTTPNVSR